MERRTKTVITVTAVGLMIAAGMFVEKSYAADKNKEVKEFEKAQKEQKEQIKKVDVEKIVEKHVEPITKSDGKEPRESYVRETKKALSNKPVKVKK